MKRLIQSSLLLLLTLLPVVARAQAYTPGSVTKWEKTTYAKSSHATRNEIVYTVRVGATTYKIARKSDKVDLQSGQAVQCEVKKKHMSVVNERGKERTYDIVGSEVGTN